MVMNHGSDQKVWTNSKSSWTYWGLMTKYDIQHSTLENSQPKINGETNQEKETDQAHSKAKGQLWSKLLNRMCKIGRSIVDPEVWMETCPPSDDMGDTYGIVTDNINKT